MNKAKTKMNNKEIYSLVVKTKRKDKEGKEKKPKDWKKSQRGKLKRYNWVVKYELYITAVLIMLLGQEF